MTNNWSKLKDKPMPNCVYLKLVFHIDLGVVRDLVLTFLCIDAGSAKIQFWIQNHVFQLFLVIGLGLSWAWSAPSSSHLGNQLEPTMPTCKCF